ncbi:MAG: hypothetical protein O7G88_07220 [bacterium]|nr:hypothetical protein [bacterium]
MAKLSRRVFIGLAGATAAFGTGCYAPGTVSRSDPVIGTPGRHQSLASFDHVVDHPNPDPGEAHPPCSTKPPKTRFGHPSPSPLRQPGASLTARRGGAMRSLDRQIRIG